MKVPLSPNLKVGENEMVEALTVFGFLLFVQSPKGPRDKRTLVKRINNRIYLIVYFPIVLSAMLPKYKAPLCSKTFAISA